MERIWNEQKTMYLEYNKYTDDAIMCDNMNGIIAVGKKDKLLKKMNK